MKENNQTTADMSGLVDIRDVKVDRSLPVEDRKMCIRDSLSMLDKHIKPKLGNYYVQSLSSVLIEQFSYELLSENGLSPKTVRDILTLLRSILKYVSRQLPSMPHIDIVYPKDSRKERCV